MTENRDQKSETSRGDRTLDEHLTSIACEPATPDREQTAQHTFAGVEISTSDTDARLIFRDPTGKYSDDTVDICGHGGTSYKQALALVALFAAAPETAAQRDELLTIANGISQIIRDGKPSTHLWNYCVEHLWTVPSAAIAHAEGRAK